MRIRAVMPRALVAFFLTLVLAGSARAGGREAFVDYYATASTLINTLNNVAADFERLNLKSGDFSDEVAEDVKLKLVKAREGFNSVLTYDDRTNELNEGYILYVDKMLLALMVAREYREKGGAERRERLVKILTEASALRTELNGKVQRYRKNYGFD
jgi:hypothetical protein